MPDPIKRSLDEIARYLVAHSLSVDEPSLSAGTMDVERLSDDLVTMIQETAIRDTKPENAAVMATMIREAERIAGKLAPHYTDFQQEMSKYINEVYGRGVRDAMQIYMESKPAITHEAVLAGSLGRLTVRFDVGPLEFVDAPIEYGQIILNLPIRYAVL